MEFDQQQQKNDLLAVLGHYPTVVDGCPFTKLRSLS